MFQYFLGYVVLLNSFIFVAARTTYRKETKFLLNNVDVMS